ncbi:MAG: CRTAC1 family protein [Gemmatimonadetes bacterium]|nr:CRTAC1 family protein [Gemmatimonadota bacterium]
MPSSPADSATPRWRRALAAALLLATIIGAIVLQRPAAVVEAPDPDEAFSRYGFVLEDIAREVGIDFVHEAPALDPRLTPIMPLIASLGAGVAVVDYDRDGWPDLYATTSAIGARNALFRNRADGTFVDVAPMLGLADVNARDTGVSMGSVWGDYDNDGDEDLFLYRWGRPELYRNESGRTFTRVDGAFDLPARIYANTAVWLDYDADGWLDLFIGCFYPEDVDLWNLQSMRFLPESFEYAGNGGRNWLLRNRGDGSFEEVALEAGLTSTRWTLAASAADLTGDGYPDLLIANDFGVSELYLNADGRTFREAGRESGIGRSPKSGMNASIGDLLNRGEWALFVSNIAEPGILMHGNDLWLRTGGDGAPVFRNAATALGVDLGGWTYGAQFVDLNLDGWLDLVVTNGFVTGPDRRSYWYDYAKVATGHRSIIADAENWPPLDGRSLSGRQADLFHVSDGAGGLIDASAAVRGDSAWDGRAVAVADLFNRGALDVIIANQRGPLQVYRNRVREDHAWIAFDLRGTVSNRSAIGAELRLFRNGRVQLQQVDGGSGFAAQRDRRVHFGLGTAASVDSVVIRWPSGIVQTIREPPPNTVHTVIEQR